MDRNLFPAEPSDAPVYWTQDAPPVYRRDNVRVFGEYYMPVAPRVEVECRECGNHGSGYHAASDEAMLACLKEHKAPFCPSCAADWTWITTPGRFSLHRSYRQILCCGKWQDADEWGMLCHECSQEYNLSGQKIDSPWRFNHD